MNFKSDGIFQKVKDDIEINNGVMKDAWIIYKEEKWYPVIVTDRKSKISGFEVNFSGKWGANIEVGRKKLPLTEFLAGIAQGAYPTNASIRCKRINDSQRNGRDFGEIQFSARLNELISRIRKVEAGEPAAHPDICSEMNAQPAVGTPGGNANSTDPDRDSDTNNADLDRSGSQGYEQDPEMRSAVELHAESIAIRHYESQGYQVKKFGKPFDLLCKKEGESIHVEVKGSRSKLDTVILTINEVSDAENAAWQSDLFVVDQIVVERIGQDLVASGGVARVIQKWVPAKEMLAPSEFRYRLPDESQWSFLK